MRATIDFASFNAVVEGIQKGHTGSAFIINSAGEFQTEPKSEPTLDKAVLLAFFGQKSAWSEDDERSGHLATLADTSFYHPKPAWTNIKVGEVGRSGNRYVFVATPIKIGEWILAYQQNSKDAFSDLGKARWIAVSMFILGSLGIVLMAFFLSHRMVRHIELADMEKAK